MLPDGIGSDSILSTTSGIEGSKNLGGDPGSRLDKFVLYQVDSCKEIPDIF